MVLHYVTYDSELIEITSTALSTKGLFERYNYRGYVVLKFLKFLSLNWISKVFDSWNKTQKDFQNSINKAKNYSFNVY